MKYNNLLTKVRKGILILTINREKALNALNAETISELEHFFMVSAPRRKKIKGIVITGAGEKAFIAGADIKEFLKLNVKKATDLSQKGHNIFNAIEQFPKPIIAAVKGFSLGGGNELAMACHMRIASVKARFGQPEVNLGIIPGYGGTQRLVHLIGKGKAMELTLTGDMINAHEAHQLGMVNHVVEHDKVMAKAFEIIEKISTKGPIAVAKAIACINACHDEKQDGFALEVQSFGECAGTDDFKEGAKAFIERRKAEFQGK